MVAIAFPASTAPGQNAEEAQGRLINCHAEPHGEGVIFRRVPGLSTWGTSSQSGFRGMQGIPGSLFAGYANRVIKYTGPGAGAIVGALAGAKPILWARNNKSGTPDVVAVDVENGAFVVGINSVANYPDADVGQPNSVCHIDGYFFFGYGDGTCIASGLNSTSINIQDKATAESNPDGIVRVIAFGGNLLMFGQNSLEFWSGATVNPTGFPFNRVTATAQGLGARFAVAGHEDGFGKALLWVGNDNRVKMLQGSYLATDVTPPDLARLIEAVTDKDTLEATCYVVGGRAMWVLSCADWTWEFNVQTLKWNERASHDDTRWRGTQAHFFNGQWLIGDKASGNVNLIDGVAQDECGNILRFRAESLPVVKFPARIQVPRADFDITTGVGVATGQTPNLTDPRCAISWSDDGLNWSNPLFRPIGRQADARQRVSVLRTGLSGPRGRRWRVDVSDPVHVAMKGGDMHANARP